jgi:hypothetical protein
MMRVSLRSFPVSHVPRNLHTKPGAGVQMRAGLRKLVQALRREADTFAAVGLAEGGDVEGAIELLDRSMHR